MTARPKNNLNGGYRYYHVTFKKSKNRDFAIDVGKFMGQSKQALARVKSSDGQAFPAYQKQLESTELKEYLKGDPGWEVMLRIVSDPTGHAPGDRGPLLPRRRPSRASESSSTCTRRSQWASPRLKTRSKTLTNAASRSSTALGSSSESGVGWRHALSPPQFSPF